MKLPDTASGLAFGFFAVLAPLAHAESLGEFEYRSSCIQCHGETGKGDGPVATYLTQVPADLSKLTTDNGGIFPVERVYDVIEGTADIGAHGRDMPLWGIRYRERAAVIADFYTDFQFDPGRDTDGYVRARILSVIEYLSTLQNN